MLFRYRVHAIQRMFERDILEKGSSTIVFKEVPAHICDNCGEKYIDDSITKELLKRAEEIVENGVEVDIRKFEIAA